MVEQQDLKRLGSTLQSILTMGLTLEQALLEFVPLAKKMRLLSSNAVCSAARAGAQGDAFRVLTQDIQFLSEDVSACIHEADTGIEKIVSISSLLAEHEVSDSLLGDESVSELDAMLSETEQLLHWLNQLSFSLSPVVTASRKGEYLAVFSSVEAANSGEHIVSFEAVASMLKSLVSELNQQSKQQQSLLRDLTEVVQQQLSILRQLTITV